MNQPSDMAQLGDLSSHDVGVHPIYKPAGQTG